MLLLCGGTDAGSVQSCCPSDRLLASCVLQDIPLCYFMPFWSRCPSLVSAAGLRAGLTPADIASFQPQRHPLVWLVSPSYRAYLQSGIAAALAGEVLYSQRLEHELVIERVKRYLQPGTVWRYTRLM